MGNTLLKLTGVEVGPWRSRIPAKYKDDGEVMKCLKQEAEPTGT